MKIRCVGMVCRRIPMFYKSIWKKGYTLLFAQCFGFIIITFKTYNCEHNSDNIKDKIIIASRWCGGVR